MSNPAELGREPPEVTVVIPTLNRRRRLERSLGGALGQEDVDVEIVVVDDGSSDATPDFLAGVASDRVRSVRHEQPRGLPQARNAGIGQGRGRWIAFLDDDDLWAPRKLRLQLDAAARGSGWVYGSALYVDDGLSPYALDPAPDPDSVLDGLLVQQVMPAGSSNVMVRADVLAELGGFDETLAHLADWDLWTRLAVSSPGAACPEIVLACVQHGDCMHGSQTPAGFRRELARLVAKHDALRSSRGLIFDERPFMQWVAEGQVRAGRPWSAATVQVRDGFRHRDPASARRAVRAFLGADPLRRSNTGLPRPAWLAAYAWSS